MCLRAVRIRLDIVFEGSAESRQGTYSFCPVGTYEGPPAHLLEPLWPLPAEREGQLAGGAGVVGEQHEERGKSPVAAVQAEEQVVELDADARRTLLTLVAQGEENIRLPAVPAATQWRSSHTVLLFQIAVHHLPKCLVMHTVLTFAYFSRF